MNKIDPQKVIDTINENLKAIREHFDPSLLSAEEREEVLKEFIELEELALKVKTKFAD